MFVFSPFNLELVGKYIQRIGAQLLSGKYFMPTFQLMLKGSHGV